MAKIGQTNEPFAESLRISNEVSHIRDNSLCSRLTRASGERRSTERAKRSRAVGEGKEDKPLDISPVKTPDEWRGLPSRKIVARKRPKPPRKDSPAELAIYFGKSVEGFGIWQTNVKALCKFFSDNMKAGVKPDQLRAMIDRFVFDRQSRQGTRPAWQEFLWRRDELLKKTREVMPPTTRKSQWASINEKYMGVSE